MERLWRAYRAPGARGSWKLGLGLGLGVRVGVGLGLGLG